MNRFAKWTLAAAASLVATQAAAQISFYEGEGFRGRVFNTGRPVANLERYGFNDRAASAIVDRGRWEVCEDAGFRGHCAVLGRGKYGSLVQMGLSNRISSVRPARAGVKYENAPPPPPPEADYAYRRRPQERVFQARVLSAHAVMGPPEHRCWVERAPGGEPNVGGAIVGGILGGILGHQIGSGRGNNLATAGGAVAGAAVGANVGRGEAGPDVTRCANAPSGPPAYWDVAYTFKGVVHHVQTSAPPGPTVTVNGRGEPRG
jgi:hypothetical protein